MAKDLERRHIIHLAIYVPWRIARGQGSLIHLRSVELFLLINMNKLSDRGLQPHEINIRNNEFIISNDANSFSMAFQTFKLSNKYAMTRKMEFLP